MEDHVWSDPRVWETINDDYVLISLYVDDKTALPEEYQISKYTNNKVRTIGKMWSDLQTDWYKVNSQPYYVLLDHNLNKLVQPVGYTPNVEEYLRFLKSGVEAFNQQPVAAR
jgi:thiol:disulfide interchange protein DsbD